MLKKNDDCFEATLSIIFYYIVSIWEAIQQQWKPVTDTDYSDLCVI